VIAKKILNLSCNSLFGFLLLFERYVCHYRYTW